MTQPRVRAGGGEPPTILLLHGLGATGDVWAGLTGLLGGSAWVVPDLPGHGGSPPLPQYSFAAVAEAVADLVDPRATVVVGHSFGGVIGLHLAARPGVRAVVGVGIKTNWTDDELTKPGALARRPAPSWRHWSRRRWTCPASVTTPTSRTRPRSYPSSPRTADDPAAHGPAGMILCAMAWWTSPLSTNRPQVAHGVTRSPSVRRGRGS